MPEALARLSARLPIAALTNGNADLARIGIDHHFQVFVSAREHGHAKPDAPIFHATCERLGLRWLERETWVWRGVRFVGTTLWSDYDTFVPPAAPLTERLRQRHKAFRAANFYLSKMAGQRGGALFDAAAMRELALECQTWLREALAPPHPAGPMVVVTHFAPTLHSADPRYGHSPGTAGFCNALDDLLPLADLWLHGHLHCPTDLRVGRCRIVANPLGYAGKGEQLTFSHTLTVHVENR